MDEETDVPSEINSSESESEGSDCDTDDNEEDTDEFIGSEDTLEEEDILGCKKYIVEESALLDLIRNQRCRETHCRGGIIPETIEKSPIPSGLKYTFKCNNGHEFKWMTSRYYGSRCLVHMLLQMATVVSGLTVESVHLFCKSLNLAFSSKANFFGYQRLYGQGIQNFFQAHTDKLKRGIEGKQNVILVYTRYDSPGFSASKATTIFMDLDTKNIVHIEVGHKNECGGSAKLEGFLFEKGLDHLIGMGLQVKEIVTDASRTLISILEKPKYSKITHSLDVWHKAKKINEKLGLDSKKKTNKSLRPWIRHIINHFWWCCSNAKGSVKKIRSKWLAILSHIRNVHVWATGACDHPNPVTPPRGCEWLEESSPSYQCLRFHVQDKYWCSSLKYYIHGRTTWRLENFNSHTLLRYCPKRLSFSFDGYTSRNQLAVLDYNHHNDRKHKENSLGDLILSTQCSRKTKEWVAYKELEEKEYSYLPSLLATIMRETYGKSARKSKQSERSLKLSEKVKEKRAESTSTCTNMKSRFS